MTEVQQEQQHDEVATPSLGARLRDARHASDFTLADVASRLRLDSEVIEALERDDYADLPERAFIRGYLLGYIRLLGLPESLLETFDREGETPDPFAGLASRPYAACSGDSWARCMSLGVVALLLLGLGLWLSEQGLLSFDLPGDGPTVVQSSPQPAAPEPEQTATLDEETPDAPMEAPADEAQLAASEQAETTPAAPMTETPEAMVEMVPATAEAAPALSMPVASPDAAPVAAEQVESSPVPTPVEGLSIIRMQFSGDSWTQVTDARGERLTSRLYKAGEDRSLQGKPPFSLIIGRVENTTLEYDGEVVELEKFSTGGTARMTLGEAAPVQP